MADYCTNCGDKQHRIDTCGEPIQPPRFTQSGFRANVYSLIPKAMMKMRINEPNTVVFYFDNDIGQFVMVKNDTKLFSAATEGYFVFKTHGDSYLITYMGTSVKRLNILFAVLKYGFWRFRHRCTLSPFEGLIGYEMNQTLYKDDDGRYTIPEERKMNTVLIIGVHTSANYVSYDFRVNANESGEINERQFNGYDGTVLYNSNYDTILFSESLRPENITRRLFSKELYSRIGRKLNTTLAQVQEDAVVNELSGSGTQGQTVPISVRFINK